MDQIDSFFIAIEYPTLKIACTIKGNIEENSLFVSLGDGEIFIYLNSCPKRVRKRRKPQIAFNS